MQLVHHPLRNLPSSQTETVPLNTASTPRSPRPCRHCHGAWWRRCLRGSDSLGTRISGTQRLPGWLADLAHRTALKAAQAAGVRSPSALRLRNSPCAADHILPSVTCGGHLCAPWLRWTMLCEPGGHRLSPPGGVCVSAVNGTLVGIEFLRLDQRLVVGHHPHRRDWNSSDPGVPVRPCPRPRSWPLRICVLSSQHVLCVESTAEPLGLASWLSLRRGGAPRAGAQGWSRRSARCSTASSPAPTGEGWLLAARRPGSEAAVDTFSFLPADTREQGAWPRARSPAVAAALCRAGLGVWPLDSCAAGFTVHLPVTSNADQV